MVMEWSLSVNKKAKTYQGILEVNGQQTFIKLLTDITGNSDSIAVLYNSKIDGSDENLKYGDTLFVLSKSPNNKFKTRWCKLEPRLLENPPKECNCFIQIK
jgi:sulfur carrier protein ThiS